ncbi:MAG: hypothetical protein ABJK11_05090 [Balneola sp.]
MIDKTKFLVLKLVAISVFWGCSSGKELYVNNKTSYLIENLQCGSVSISAEVNNDRVSVFHKFDGEFILLFTESLGVNAIGKIPPKMKKIEFLQNDEPLKEREKAFSSQDTLEFRMTLQKGYLNYNGSLQYYPSEVISCRDSRLPKVPVKIDL